MKDERKKSAVRIQTLVQGMNRAQQLEVALKEIQDLKVALDEHAIVAITDPQGRPKGPLYF
jgi:hypothetical protein